MPGINNAGIISCPFISIYLPRHLSPAPEKGFRLLVKGGTSFSKATVVYSFSN
jgi:hypothetical protein